MLRSLLLVLLLASTCFGQVKVDVTKASVITGLKSPKVVGDVIVLSEGSKPVTSEAAFFHVVTEYPSKSIIVEAQKSLFDFVDVARVSDYEWMLVGQGEFLVTVDVAPPDAARYRERLKVTLGTVTQPPVDPDPVDPPTTDFSAIRKVSEAGARKVDDPATATKLAEKLKEVSKKVPSQPSVEVAQEAVVANIKLVMDQRTGISLTKDWLTNWRLPVNDEVKKHQPKITTTFLYAQVVEEMALGLEKSLSTAGSK